MKKLLLYLFCIVFINTTKAQQDYSEAMQPNISNSFFNKTHEELPLPSQKSLYDFRQQNTLTTLLDSSYFWLWDTTSISWYLQLKDFNYIYNANNIMVGYTEQYSGVAWRNSQRYSTTYDVNNNLINELYESWNGTTWINNQLDTYTYDVNNNIMTSLSLLWDGSAWVGFRQEIYSYNVNNKLMLSKVLSWNDVSVSWDSIVQDVYTYNVNNFVAVDVQLSWNGSSWNNSYRNSNSYDPSNNLTGMFGENWNGTSWESYNLYTATYNANNLETGFTTQRWNGNTWVNRRKFTYGYDANNLNVENISQDWNGNSWVNSYRWYNYYHSIISGVNIADLQNSTILIYPNPFSSQATISFTESQKGITTIRIVDLFGKEIKSFITTGNQITIEREGMKAGIYFVQLIDENKNSVTRKMIVQ